MKKICLAYFDHGKGRRYVPLDLGYVKAKILPKYPEAEIEIFRIEARLDKDEEAVKKEALFISDFVEADILIFFLDNILWSMMFYSKGAQTIASVLKERNKNLQIGLHSYKLTDSMSRKILKEFETIDFIVRGEPEAPIMELYEKGDFRGIPGYVYRKEGTVYFEPDAPFLDDLDKNLPSPYLSGVLDDILEEDNHSTFMTTSRGCPFKCHYCSRSVKFSKVRTFSVERFLDELEYLAKKQIKNVFMLDDCFIVNKDRFFEMVQKYEERFSRSGLCLPFLQIMSRPEFLSDEVLEALPKLKINFVQIGLQTIHPEAQFLMGRGVKIEDFRRITDKLYEAGIHIHIDIIIGLPHDDLEHFKKTFDFAVSLHCTTLQIKQLYQNPHTLFDLSPEKYGLNVEKKTNLFHVPFVKSSNTFSNADIKKAAEYVKAYRDKNPLPKIKLVTEFIRFDDFKGRSA